MAEKRTGRVPAIRISGAGARNLHINTAASRYLLGYSEVNVYEKGAVMAIEGALKGSYHLSREKGRDRSVISSMELVSHILEKYKRNGKAVLPVWEGQQEGVLFFGKAAPTKEIPPVLDETWTPLETEYNRRAGEWVYVHDNWIEVTKGIRTQLPDRLRAYQAGQVTVLKPETDGPLRVTSHRQRGNRMLDEPMLARYLRETYSGEAAGLRLRACSTQDGLVLIASEEGALAGFRSKSMKPIELDETMLRFVTLHGKGGLYLSVRAYQAMGSCERVSAYCCGDWLALKPDPEGDKRVFTSGYVQEIFSSRLGDFLLRHYPEQGKYYLVQRGELWVFMTQPEAEELPPSPGRFRRLELTSRAQGRAEQGQPALPDSSRARYPHREVRV